MTASVTNGRALRYAEGSARGLLHHQRGHCLVLGRDGEGVLGQKAITLPDNVKLKRYRQQFRTRFCEGLLARRVLVAEGATETSAFPVACRRLAELKPDTYASLEALGVCIVDAGGETDIPGMAKLYRDLGKRTFAICDKQGDANKDLIEAQVELLLMHEEKGFEAMVLQGTTEAALKRFTKLIDWPQDLAQKYPDPEAQAVDSLTDYFAKSKGNWGIADFLAQCSEAEIPQWLRNAAVNLRDACLPIPAGGGQAAAPAADEHPEAVDGAD